MIRKKQVADDASASVAIVVTLGIVTSGATPVYDVNQFFKQQKIVWYGT